MASFTPPDPESHLRITNTIIDSLIREIKTLNDKTTTNGPTAENLSRAILAGAEKAAQEITMAGAGGPATNLRDSTVAQHVQDKEEEVMAKQKDVEALQARMEEVERKVTRLSRPHDDYCGYNSENEEWSCDV